MKDERFFMSAAKTEDFILSFAHLFVPLAA